MDIQPMQILLQLINFGLVVFVLMKLLYKPVSKVLEARSEKIKQGMDAAEKNIAEQKKMETQVKAELTKARKEAQKILSDAKKQADIESAAIVAKAKEQAQKTTSAELEAGQSMIKEAQAKAALQIKEMVTATTAKILGDSLTAADQKRIIDSQIKQLKDIKFS